MPASMLYSLLLYIKNTILQDILQALCDICAHRYIYIYIYMEEHCEDRFAKYEWITDIHMQMLIVLRGQQVNLTLDIGMCMHNAQ